MPLYEYIPSGWRGTERTIQHMRELAVAAAKSWGFIRIATPFAFGMPRNFRGQGERILEWVKKHIEYVPDPVTAADEDGVPQGMELVQAPLRTIQRKAGDCIPLSQKIILRDKASGQYAVKAVGDIRENFSDYEALSYAMDGRQWVFSPVTQWIDKGKKPVQRVRLRSGQSFFCTPDHKIWTLKSSRFTPHREPLAGIAGFSRPYMRGVMCAHRLPSLNGTPGISAAQLFIEGLYTAEGFSGEPFRAEIANKNETLIDYTCRCLDQLGIPYRLRLRKDGVRLVYLKASWLTKRLHEMFGRTSWVKHFPDEYLSLSRDAMEVLLLAYGLGDAYIPKPGGIWHERASKIYNTNSDRLAHQLIVMHMILGRPVSPWYQRNPRGAGRIQRPMWRIACKDLENRRCHLERQPGVENITIKKIDDVGEAEVCDISVAGTHNFVAEDGAILSNCDDHSTLIAAIGMVLGIPAEFATIKADPRRPADFSHVYPRLLIDGEWVGCDSTVARSRLGWEPERFWEKRSWRI